MYTDEEIQYAAKYNDLTHFYRNAWRWKCGLPEVEYRKDTLDELYRSEWSTEFENAVRNILYELKQDTLIEERIGKITEDVLINFFNLLHNRLIQGAFRYGKLHDKDKPNYDYMSAAFRYYGDYVITKNKERLIDVANYALLLYEKEGNYTIYLQCIRSYYNEDIDYVLIANLLSFCEGVTCMPLSIEGKSLRKDRFAYLTIACILEFVESTAGETFFEAIGCDTEIHAEVKH